jgi:DNA-binding response OmpR family regulator
MNVLLLEDELELSAVACEQIESRGHTVFPALDIAQAKAILADPSVQIDILIADQMVPDGNGTTFAIETNEMEDRIGVVVVSGQLNDSDMEKLDANKVAYYSKPTLYAEIVEDLIRNRFPGKQGDCLAG